MSLMYPFTFDWCDENGTLLVGDLDVEVEIDAELDYSREPATVCIGVWLNGVNMLTSKSPTVKGLGCEIANAVEDNSDIERRALQDAEIIWRGRSANDPAGRFEFM